MRHNVGYNEQIARIGIGAAAAAAAVRAHGWQRTALCSVATAGFMTALMRFCPLKAALRMNTGTVPLGLSEHDLSVRNTEIRRETQTSAAMGRLAGTAVQPLTPAGDRS